MHELTSSTLLRFVRFFCVDARFCVNWESADMHVKQGRTKSHRIWRTSLVKAVKHF